MRGGGQGESLKICENDISVGAGIFLTRRLRLWALARDLHVPLVACYPSPWLKVSNAL
jgi:hypothetical protein